MPTLDEIAAFAEETVRKSDLDTLSVKAIIKLIAEKIGAEKGRDYEKSWLTGQIDRVLSLVRAEAAAAAAAAPPPAPRAASQDMGMFMSWPDMKVGERALRLSRTLKNVPSPSL